MEAFNHHKGIILNDVSHEEYLEILSIPKYCDDYPEWINDGDKHHIRYVLKCGTLDEDGVSNGYTVDITVQRSHKVRKTSYRMGLFRNNIYFGNERVYQLDIKKFDKKINDEHLKPHEHCGSQRLRIDDDLDFNTAINRFCNKTNTTFNPPLEDPENFRLR